MFTSLMALMKVFSFFIFVWKDPFQNNPECLSRPTAFAFSIYGLVKAQIYIFRCAYIGMISEEFDVKV